MRELAVLEETCKHRQRVIGQGLIDERLLQLKRPLRIRGSLSHNGRGRYEPRSGLTALHAKWDANEAAAVILITGKETKGG